jgi:OHCU decarboxylase
MRLFLGAALKIRPSARIIVTAPGDEALAQRPVTLHEINALDQPAFVARLGALFEDSPWIAAFAWHTRPFASRDALYQALCQIMYGASEERQLALIQAHPDLVGRAALAGTLTTESTREQAAAGLDHLSPDEIATFSRLNAAYRERFDFPFVISRRKSKSPWARLPRSRACVSTTRLLRMSRSVTIISTRWISGSRCPC